MSKIQIPRTEFTTRLERIQAAMAERRLELLIVYGDEYRKENLRYVCNFWPIFERAACFIPRRGLPVLAGAPEGAVYARRMPWPEGSRPHPWLYSLGANAISFAAGWALAGYGLPGL